MTQYPKEPEFIDQRSATEPIGKRIQSILYLFEEEGSFTIPGVETSWWNPWAKQMYSKQTHNIDIKVAPNPDLGMLASIKDSLNSEKIVQAIDVESVPWWKRPDVHKMIVGIVSGLLLFIIVFWILKRLYNRLYVVYSNYIAEESYAYKQMMQSLKTKKIHHESFYNWLIKNDCITFDQFIEKKNVLVNEEEILLIHRYINSKLDDKEFVDLMFLIKKLRNHVNKEKTGCEVLEINP